MKVLQINTAASRGGAALAAANINNALNLYGVNSTFLNSRETSNSLTKLFYLGESKWRLRANVFAYRMLGIDGFFNDRLWKPWIDKLPEYDVIHLHNAHGYYFPLDILETVLARPCVWTLHDYWLATGGPTSPIPGVSQRSLIKRVFPFANLAYPIEWFDRSIKRREKLYSLVERTKPTLVIPSYTAAEQLRELGLNTIDLNVIPHGLFDDEYAPDVQDKITGRLKKGWPLQKHILLFVSSIVDNEIKGFEVFLKALRVLNVPSDWVAFVAGGDNVRARFMAKRAELDIHFLDNLGNKELKECYGACDTYVTPALSETYGMTVVEALAEGAQVVCSDLPVLREVSNDAAIFFKPGDFIELGSIIQRLIDCPNKTDRSIVASSVRRRYSRKQMAREYLNIYQSTIIRSTMCGLGVIR